MGQGVIKGLSLLEGSFPVDHLNPALKHLVHYGRQTGNKGLLDWFSMFVFERNNKKVKGMSKSTKQPLSSLANHVELEIQMRKKVFSDTPASDFQHGSTESFYVRCRLHTLSQRQKHDM